MDGWILEQRHQMRRPTARENEGLIQYCDSGDIKAGIIKIRGWMGQGLGFLLYFSHSLHIYFINGVLSTKRS